MRAGPLSGNGQRVRLNADRRWIPIGGRRLRNSLRYQRADANAAGQARNDRAKELSALHKPWFHLIILG
jgi:hypothetical protein